MQSITDLIGCDSCYEDFEVYASEVLNIKAEWRCFILYDKIIDIRQYCADILDEKNDTWKYNYDYEVIENMIEQFKTWKDRPVACSMDIAVIDTDIPVEIIREHDDGTVEHIGWRCRPNYETVLIEFNDAYALGNYGLIPIAYAKMISARWSQLLSRTDEYNFNTIL